MWRDYTESNLLTWNFAYFKVYILQESTAKGVALPHFFESIERWSTQNPPCPKFSIPGNPARETLIFAFQLHVGATFSF